jgi:type IV fimbrial biogenesis protein FimT
VATPSFTTVVKNSRVRTQSSDLMVNLAIARAEAAKRGTRVTMCPSNTYNVTPPSCTVGTLGSNWALGYIVFADQNGNGTFDSANDVLIAVAEPLSGNNTLVGTGFSGNNAAGTSIPNEIQFRSSGVTNLPAVGGSFKLCDDRSGNVGRTITVTVTGRATSATTTCP